MKNRINMRFRCNAAALLALLVTASVSTGATVSLSSLLREMKDFDAVARWPKPEFTSRQCSSYDRAELAPDKPGWFANNDFSQYIRTEQNAGHDERVMMDADGPGCIVRFWLTTTQNKSGVLRVYLDGESEPALSFAAFDLLCGDLNLPSALLQPHPGYSPTANGGSTLMLPIPYAKHCKLTWQETGEGPRYYQIQYRTYALGTLVKTFTREDLAAAHGLIAQVSKNLRMPAASSANKELSSSNAISPGRSVSLNLRSGPAAIRQLELQIVPEPSADLERTLRSTILQIHFDNEETVWCPVSDFFGSGVGVNALQSWYRTVQGDGKMICRWVMPYAKSAQVTIINLGEHPVRAVLRAKTGAWRWDDRSMLFHTAWHYEAGLTTPPARDWNFIRIAGRGVYVGDTLSLFNPVATWYGEGDEKIRVDAESLPSFLGTGTEDYYDFSFAPRGLMQTPFANQVRVDQSMTQGNNVLTRTRNLDGIPFSKSLDFDIELISWQPTKLVYAATTYWYAFPGASSNLKAQPEAASRPLPSLANP